MMSMDGPDHRTSLEPRELKSMVKAIRIIEKALGNGIKRPTENELKLTKATRRSLVATRDIKAGEVLKESDIAIKRSKTGVPPKFKEIVIGMRPMRDIKKDESFNWEDFK